MLGMKTKETEVTTAPATRSGEPREVSIIAREMSVVGDCVTDGRLRIEGKIAGDVRARGLEVMQSGAVSGDLSTPDDGGGDLVFVIHGRVEGTVRARQVEVRQTGEVLGGVVADQATVHGRVKGGVVARIRLALEETAVVEGDVRARRLALKEGGQVNGTILMGERAALELDDAGTKGSKPEKGMRGSTSAADKAATPAVGSEPAQEESPGELTPASSGTGSPSKKTA